VLTEAKAVVTVFEDNNPGLTLIISPVRDLQRQVDLWCKNKTVKQAAARLIQDARAKLAESNFLASPTAASVSDFRSYLKTYLVDPEPSSAAPGTSDHGQQHAVDFVVKEKGGRTLADTETATIRTSWHNTGFDKALKTATEEHSCCTGSRHTRLAGSAAEAVRAVALHLAEGPAQSGPASRAHAQPATRLTRYSNSNSSAPADETRSKVRARACLIDHPNMLAAVSADGRTLTLIVRNAERSASKGFTFDLTALPTVGAMAEAHRTSRTEDLISLPALSIQDWSFTAMVPAYSVTTFVVPMP